MSTRVPAGMDLRAASRACRVGGSGRRRPLLLSAPWLQVLPSLLLLPPLLLILVLMRALNLASPQQSDRSGLQKGLARGLLSVAMVAKSLVGHKLCTPAYNRRKNWCPHPAPPFPAHPPQNRQAGGSARPAAVASAHCGRAQSANPTAAHARVALNWRCPAAGIDSGRANGAAGSICTAASNICCARPGRQSPAASGEASYMPGLKSGSSAA